MRSSIFSSDRLSPAHAIALLLGGVLAYCAVLEVGARVLVPRVSRESRREAQDHVKARSLSQTAANGAPTVLLVGNSLLLKSVDREQLQADLAHQCEVTVFPIENTSYLDWYFGLRRLFAEGGRPGVVILCMNARQLSGDATNGEIFAHSLMQTSDVGRVVQAAHLNATTATGYFLANISAWLGRRTGVRNWLLEQMVPGASTLVAAFTPPSATPPPLEEVVQAGSEHLRALQELCEAHSSRFYWVVPPADNPSDPSTALVAAARQQGLQALVPYAPGEMDASLFADGFHLNAAGAELFTGRLATLLSDVLSRIAPNPVETGSAPRAVDATTPPPAPAPR